MASRTGPDPGPSFRTRAYRRGGGQAGRGTQGIQDRRRRRHRSGEGRQGSRARSPASAARFAYQVSGDATKTIKSTKPDVVVLCTSSSMKKVLPQIEAILKLKVPIVSTTEELAYPTQGQPALREGDPRAREKSEGRRARHRREPGLRDGRAADHADRRLRARRGAAHRPHPGRAHSAAAVPAENRRRPHPRAVPDARWTTAACGTSGWPNRYR